MKHIIVIPARRGSTRFPNKPLALVAGRSVLQRVWKIAKSVETIDQVIIATDDRSIQEHAQSFGAQVILSQTNCSNGTLRVLDAIEQLGVPPEYIINLQGDAVLTPPSVIQALHQAMISNENIDFLTPAVALSWQQYDSLIAAKSVGQTSGTLVVFDRNQNALYFSKAVIPHLSSRNPLAPPVYRHIGIYGYSFPGLKKYASLSPTALEEAEHLEQLRLLEHGVPIKIVIVDYLGRSHWSIDNPSDIAIVENLIRREGELLNWT